jgi:cell division protein FtsL
MATLAPRLDRFTAARNFEQEIPRPRILEGEDRYAIPRFPNDDVYLYIKRIDNSRVAREADKGAPQMCWRLIGSSFAVAILVIGLLLPTLYGLMAGYRLEALRQEKQRLELDRASLELQETKLLSPARLEELARRQRFVDPASESVVYLDEKSSERILAKK